MAVQVNSNITTVPFIRFSYPSTSRTNSIIAQDALRTTDLAPYTIMAKIAASQKWVPFTDETATDGSAIPQGIYIGSAIASADIVAGDVEDVEILESGAIYDINQVVIENSKTLDTVITVGTTDLKTVRDHLACRNIHDDDTVDITEYENA